MRADSAKANFMQKIETDWVESSFTRRELRSVGDSAPRQLDTPHRAAMSTVLIALKLDDENGTS